MSTLKINWAKLLGAREEISKDFCDRLNAYFTRLQESHQIPDVLGAVHVERFALPESSLAQPEVELIDVTDPWPEFYQETARDADMLREYMGGDSVSEDYVNGDDSTSTPFTRSRQDTDVQMQMRLRYHGPCEIIIHTELSLNYPAPSFLTLPIKLRVHAMDIDATAVIAYLSSKVCVCVCQHGEDGQMPVFALPLKSPMSAMVTSPMSMVPLLMSPTTSIAQQHYPFQLDLRIESDIGDQASEQVLKNVGKIEKFLVEHLRRYLLEHYLFPKFHSTYLVSTSDDVDNSSSDMSVE